MLQSAQRLYADEMITEVPATHLDALWFAHFYRVAFGAELSGVEIAQATLLENLKLAREEHLTLAGLLLFGKNVSWSRPQFGIKGTVYLTADEFRDKEDISGNLFEQYKRGVDFVLRNLHRIPQAADFNVPGEVEIPAGAVREVIANALVHRDYFIDASVQINIFPDAVEVVSPGVLPDTVTVENVKLGIHLERNPILLSFTAKDPEFGYTGRGSGIPRVLRLCKEKGITVSLENDAVRQQFRVCFDR
ncbi:MAG: hypothetical protein JXA33_02945 [Anaerolineae bacterium]|nr:hypothetical protein [Anaerolineae bacterium]